MLALTGMIARNSVILIDQIEKDKAKGLHPWDAVIDATAHRFRPILLTASAAILGMAPIAPTVFWGPMAYAIMGGVGGRNGPDPCVPSGALRGLVSDQTARAECRRQPAGGWPEGRARAACPRQPSARADRLASRGKSAPVRGSSKENASWTWVRKRQPTLAQPTASARASSSPSTSSRGDPRRLSATATCETGRNENNRVRVTDVKVDIALGTNPNELPHLDPALS